MARTSRGGGSGRQRDFRRDGADVDARTSRLASRGRQRAPPVSEGRERGRGGLLRAGLLVGFGPFLLLSFFFFVLSPLLFYFCFIS